MAFDQVLRRVFRGAALAGTMFAAYGASAEEEPCNTQPQAQTEDDVVPYARRAIDPKFKRMEERQRLIEWQRNLMKEMMDNKLSELSGCVSPRDDLNPKCAPQKGLPPLDAKKSAPVETKDTKPETKQGDERDQCKRYVVPTA